MGLSPENCAEGGCPCCMPTERWEYTVVEPPHPLAQSLLNEYGADGWELCSVADPANFSRKRYYFKRKKSTWST